MKSTTKAGPKLIASQAEYANHRGVGRPHINRLVKAGVLILKDGKVDVRASDAVLDDRAKLALGGKPGSPEAQLQLDGEPKSYAAARFEREVYVGRLRRLEFEQKAGSLIPAAEVTKAWTRVAETIKHRLTALPMKMAPVLAAITDEQQIRKLIEVEINATLRALAAEVRIGS